MVMNTMMIEKLAERIGDQVKRMIVNNELDLADALAKAHENHEEGPFRFGLSMRSVLEPEDNDEKCKVSTTVSWSVKEICKDEILVSSQPDLVDQMDNAGIPMTASQMSRFESKKLMDGNAYVIPPKPLQPMAEPGVHFKPEHTPVEFVRGDDDGQDMGGETGPAREGEGELQATHSENPASLPRDEDGPSR
jgi:hypothetical protein